MLLIIIRKLAIAPVSAKAFTNLATASEALENTEIAVLTAICAVNIQPPLLIPALKASLTASIAVLVECKAVSKLTKLLLLKIFLKVDTAVFTNFPICPLIALNAALTADLTLFRFSAMPPNPAACAALSKACIMFATPRTTAVLMFLNDVAIPIEFTRANCAKPFNPPSSSISLSENWSKVIVPFFRAS